MRKVHLLLAVTFCLGWGPAAIAGQPGGLKQLGAYGQQSKQAQKLPKKKPHKSGASPAARSNSGDDYNVLRIQSGMGGEAFSN